VAVSLSGTRGGPPDRAGCLTGGVSPLAGGGISSFRPVRVRLTASELNDFVHRAGAHAPVGCAIRALARSNLQLTAIQIMDQITCGTSGIVLVANLLNLAD
jgi:hypothetical protein